MPTKQALERLITLQTTVLKMIAYGEPIQAISGTICREAEDISGEASCVIFSVDQDGRMHPLAAPSLPLPFLRRFAETNAPASDVTPIAFNQPVTVLDVEKDARFAPYLDVMIPFGLLSYWSSPIRSRDGRLLGKVGFYYTRKRGPNATEEAIVASLTCLCAVMLENQEIQRKVKDLAFIDTLSRLPNRASYNDRLSMLMEDATSPFALLLLDIDYLKSVNDTMGHAVGDALIRTMGARLKGIGGTVEPFRLSGDEFSLIVHGCDTEDAMEQVARSIISEAGIPFEANGYSVVPSVTIGGAIYDATQQGADRLQENADLALYHGKELGRGSFVAYKPGLQTSIAERVKLMGDLGAALREGRIEAFFQPIVQIDTGAIVGMEALARMLSYEGTIVPAADFYKATSDPRLAYDLSGVMLKQIASAVRGWLDFGIPFQHIGFNVTQADFKQGDIERRITEAFADAGVPLKHIILEVNEAVYLGPGDDFVARAVERLRAKGILVALDDFGTGFASLTHLLSFPVDIIKIDRSFVTDIVTDKNSCVIVEALLGIASKLGMRIVAEGIETVEQAEKLMSMGCRLGQGYRFAPPVPRSLATELLQRLGEGVHRAAETPNAEVDHIAQR
ncbi:EAL domain-containing protein [Tianweitania sp.]|uniref:bifunctional diguanylate cyclase/phosphodiesterase n=1 Tax=Tianweitania sp. TaxID=2021634 RepID=UPI0028A1440D|nr:EAL domain-containing protein [Tianweitania sp.]